MSGGRSHEQKKLKRKITELSERKGVFLSQEDKIRKEKMDKKFRRELKKKREKIFNDFISPHFFYLRIFFIIFNFILAVIVLSFLFIFIIVALRLRLEKQ